MAKTVQDLRALGFKDAPTQIPKRLITSVYGLEKSGKTHFALTAPEPIIYFDIDIGSEGVVEKFKRAGREILVWEVRVPKGEKQSVYESMWAEFKLRLTQAFSLGKGTVVLDSVTYESPLVLKDKDGRVWIGTIEDFWLMQPQEGTVTTPRGEQVLDVSGAGWKVYNTVWNKETQKRVNPWTLIKTIIRHPYKGSVLRFTATGGTIRVTPNHSLLSKSGDLVEASKLTVDDELSLPMYVHTATNLSCHKNGCSLFVGSLELAWLYGFFVAEGCTYPSKDKRSPGWSGRRLSISNKDKSLVDKSERILEETFHTSVSVQMDKGDKVWKAVAQDSEVGAHFDSLFYNSKREKVVPPLILNAVAAVKDAFIAGYLEGDGYCGDSDIWQFATTSPALASAIIWMKRSASLKSNDVTVYTRQDKPTVTQVNFPRKAKFPWGRIRSIVEEQYDGMVYDLETENHAFCAGVGGILAHNTGTESYEMNRLARFGKLTQILPHNYVEVNTEWREMLRQAFDSGMNAIFIHKMKSKYIQNVRTSEYEIAGFGEMGYLVQVNARCSRIDFADGKQSQFVVRIDDCRHNPVLNGLQLANEAINFSVLVEMVHASIATH